MAFAGHFQLRHVKRGPYTCRDIQLLDQLEESIINVQDIDKVLPSIASAYANMHTFQNKLLRHRTASIADPVARGALRRVLLNPLTAAVAFSVGACTLHGILDDAWQDDPWVFRHLLVDNQIIINHMLRELKLQLEYTESVRTSCAHHADTCQRALQHIRIDHLSSDSQSSDTE